MNSPSTTADFWDFLAKVLLRCWLLGFGLMLLWLGAILLLGDFVHRVHGQMFGLTSHELDLIFYCGLGLLKLLVLVCFFFPWLAIVLVQRAARAK